MSTLTLTKQALRVQTHTLVPFVGMANFDSLAGRKFVTGVNYIRDQLEKQGVASKRLCACGIASSLCLLNSVCHFALLSN